MSNGLPEDRTPDPVTVDSIADDLCDLGVESGQTLLVHASLSSLGWVCGGAPAVIDALQRVIGENGTLVMPTHTSDNMDPADWENPPVPERWHDTIREQMPAYRPDVTPCPRMGAIAECFRTYPNVHRSDHPQHSFAAWGSDAEFVTSDHTLGHSLGENSPLASVYALDGYVLLLGTTHATNTSYHLAEYRAGIDHEHRTCSGAVLIDGHREWIEWEDIELSDADFPNCGIAFERKHPNDVSVASVGVGEAKLLPQRHLVDFAVNWFERNRQ